MQLNEILEEQSIKSISQRTNISEENLETLLAGEFDKLTKVKTMGFISIIEREYDADLKALRQQALSYYDEHQKEDGIVLDVPVEDRQKGRSKWLVLIILVLIGVASWYFVTHFDREKFKRIIPFPSEQASKSIKNAVDEDPDLSIEHAITEETQSDTNMAESNIKYTEENQSNALNEQSEI